MFCLLFSGFQYASQSESAFRCGNQSIGLRRNKEALDARQRWTKEARKTVAPGCRQCECEPAASTPAAVARSHSRE